MANNRLTRQRVSLAIWMAFGSVLLSLVLSVGVYLVVTAERKRTDKIALATHNALCSFKSDLEGRAENTERFISEIERGERGLIPGITLADLERSLAAQQATLESLGNLDCG